MEYRVFDPDDLFDGIIDRMEVQNVSRQDVGNRSNQALRLAKKAIFALQRRGDTETMAKELTTARGILLMLQAEYGKSRQRNHNGQWRVALEEFLEALFFLQFCRGDALDIEQDPLVRQDSECLVFTDEEIFGALSDFTGEAYRQMQLWISEERYDDSLRANRAIARVTELLNQNTSGGSLRSKVDQANRNLHNSDARITDLKTRSIL